MESRLKAQRSFRGVKVVVGLICIVSKRAFSGMSGTRVCIYTTRYIRFTIIFYTMSQIVGNAIPIQTDLVSL